MSEQVFLAQQDDKEPERISLGMGVLGLIAGVMDEFKMVERVDQLIPKTANNVCVTSGQVFKMLVLNLVSGAHKYFGLSNVQTRAAEMDIPCLFKLGPDEDPIKIIHGLSRHTCGAFLDDVALFGPTLFSSTLISSMFGERCEGVTVAHLDSTSKHIHCLPKNELPSEELLNRKETPLKVKAMVKAMQNALWDSDATPLNLKRGYSRDSHAELPQVNILGISAKVPNCSRPQIIYQSTFSGNVNDITQFRLFFEKECKELLKIYPNIKYFIADSAAAHDKTIQSCRALGLHLVTRLSDLRSEVKKIYKDLDKGIIQMEPVVVKDDEGNEETIYAARVGSLKIKPTDSTDKSSGKGSTMQMIVYRAEAMREQKTRLIGRKAEKELDKIERALDKLRTQPSKCQADAQMRFQELTKDLKFCTVSEPVYKPKVGYSSAGRPKKGDEPQVVACPVLATVSIDQAKVDAAINKELLYVLASTDTTLSIDGLYKSYHDQKFIEGCWKSTKQPGFFAESIYLKSPSRIRALISLLAVALAIVRIVESRIRDYLKNSNRKLQIPGQKPTATPSWSTLINNAVVAGVQALADDQRGVFALSGLGRGSLMVALINAVGPACFKYYQKDEHLKRAWHYQRQAQLRHKLQLSNDDSWDAIDEQILYVC